MMTTPTAQVRDAPAQQSPGDSGQSWRWRVHRSAEPSSRASRLSSTKSQAEGRSRRNRSAERSRRSLPYLILLGIGAVLLLAEALLHHRAFGTGYDLGIYDQVVWNLAHGRWFMTTLVYETGGYYDHFEPILALIAPIYWLIPDVRVLLVIQSLMLALGSLPIYLYARHRLGAAGKTRFTFVPVLMAAAYLAYPALHNANLNDFHEVALAPPLLGFALYGLLTGRRRLTFLALAACLLVKEDLTVTALTFGAYIFLFLPAGFRRRDGILLALAAVLWGLLVLRLFYPALTRGMPYPFVDRRYPWMGTTPESALKVFFTQPWLVLSHFLQPAKLLFVLRLFAPLLFLPLWGWPAIFLAFPIFFYLMLSGYEPQWSIQSYYNPPLLPILFFSLIVAWERILRWVQRRDRSAEPSSRASRLSDSTELVEVSTKSQAEGRSRRSLPTRPAIFILSALLILGVSLGYYFFALSPGGRQTDPNLLRLTAEDRAAQAILQQTPPGAAISTEWQFVPHLSQRQRIYTLLSRPSDPPDYLLVRLDPGAQSAPLYPYAAADDFPPAYHEYAAVATIAPFQLQALQSSYTLVPFSGPEPDPAPISLEAYAWLDSPDLSQPPLLPPGSQTRLMLAWGRNGPTDRRYVFFTHLLDANKPNSDSSPRRLAQTDHELGYGRFPTPYWGTWTNPHIVLDEHILAIPADTPAGVYEVWAGIYDRETLSRLEVGGPGETLVAIGEVRVGE